MLIEGPPLGGVNVSEVTIIRPGADLTILGVGEMAKQACELLLALGMLLAASGAI